MLPLSGFPQANGSCIALYPVSSGGRSQLQWAGRWIHRGGELLVLFAVGQLCDLALTVDHKLRQSRRRQTWWWLGDLLQGYLGTPTIQMHDDQNWMRRPQSPCIHTNTWVASTYHGLARCIPDTWNYVLKCTIKMLKWWVGRKRGNNCGISRRHNVTRHVVSELATFGWWGLRGTSSLRHQCWSWDEALTVRVACRGRGRWCGW